MLEELWKLIVMLFATRLSDFIYKELEGVCKDIVIFKRLNNSNYGK